MFITEFEGNTNYLNGTGKKINDKVIRRTMRVYFIHTQQLIYKIQN